MKGTFTTGERALRAARLALIALLAPVAALAAPAALVVDVMGAAAPAVEPFEELEAGAEVTLAPDAEIFVIHYAACTESHVRGGGFVVGPFGLTLAPGAERLAETEIECPRKVVFAETADRAASVVLRSAGDSVAINRRPVFVILGRVGVSEVRIARDGAPVAALPVMDGLARLPAGAAALEAGPGYEIAIVTAAGVRAAAASVAADAGVTIIAP